MTQINGATMLPEEQREGLYRLWSEETEAPETQEWRDDLTPEEEIYVESLDRGFSAGCRQISTVILILDDIYRSFPEGKIQEVSRRGSHCRLEFTDGRVYDCWRDDGGKVHYTEEESQA